MKAEQGLRVQTECNLVVRLRWEVGDGHSHPEHTFLCVQDAAMAVTAAANASRAAPRGLRLVGADTSPSGGRLDPWVPLALEFAEDRSAGWLSGACT